MLFAGASGGGLLTILTDILHALLLVFHSNRLCHIQVYLSKFFKGVTKHLQSALSIWRDVFLRSKRINQKSDTP